jgi:glutathione reductase (NADPH)
MVGTEPEAGKDYDLIVIGTGNAGMAMALEARRAGWKVAIADEMPYGGTCAVKGCIPKKALAGAAEVIERANAMKNKGISGDLRIVWPDLIMFKRTFTDPVPVTREGIFTKERIDTYHGHARFLGRNTLMIGDTTVNTRFTGIATGAIPRRLGIPGEEFVSTSDDFLAMESLPKRIVFIGGGFISFEFAHVAAKAGAAVTILHRGGMVLKEFDPFLTGVLVQALRTSGIEILTDMPVLSVEKSADSLHVHAGKIDERVFEADMVVNGAGRVPNTTGLDLDAGNVAIDERGIAINQYLQSVSNPSVYVAGDVNARGKPLSPVATMEGRAAARNMIHGNTVVPDYMAVPTVVFVSPLLASVGLREDQAAKRGITPVLYRKETPEWYSTRRVGMTHSGYKILTEGKLGRILGAHLLGYNADEVINVFALAIRFGLTLADLQEMAWAYPTGTYDTNRIG